MAHPDFRLFLGVCTALIVAVSFSSCSSSKPKRPKKLKKLTGSTQYIEAMSGGALKYPVANAKIEAWWKDAGVSGSPKVVISLGEQKAYFYKGEMLVGLSSISSGEQNYPTPTGRYSIIQKNINHRSSQYGDYVDAQGNVVIENIERGVDPMPKGTRYRGASMPYFMRFVRGVGMHAGYLPGYPASHGCVRMPDHMAETFFGNVSIGTPVIVKN